jgi:integrase
LGLRIPQEKGGRRAAKKRITIGRVTDFTADGARKAADSLRSAVKTGSDPQGDKARQREANTVADLAEVFLSEHVGAKRKASTAAHYRDVLERLVVPKLGRHKAKDVTRAEVAKLHLSNSATPFQANRILAVLGSMYTFGARHGLVREGQNPARGIERFKEEPRERLLSPKELERLGAAIREAELSAYHGPLTLQESRNTFRS